MVTSTLTRMSLAELTLTDTPTLGQVQAWWEAMQNDPTRYLVYTDFMPTEFEEFLAPVQHGDIQLHMMLAGREVGGAFYLHDSGTDDTGAAYAWLGVYILPPYRGQCAARAWRLVRRACEREGLHRIFAAIRAQNRPAQCFITRTMGFTRLGSYTDWSYFEGHLDRVCLYTLRQQDQSLAWVLAEQRAQQFRRRRPPVRAGQRHACQSVESLAKILTVEGKQAIYTRGLA
jgi:RimJ/RimL family protein N-acetyltransferase